MVSRRTSPTMNLPTHTKLLLAVGLAFWAWMLVDLVLHPLAAGPNAGGSLFRWLSALTGIGTVTTALYILRRVPENPVSLLLFVWGLGSTGWSIRSDWVNIPMGTLARLLFILTFLCLSAPAVTLMMFYFPNGKPYPPRLGRWMPIIFGVLVLAGLFSVIAMPSAADGTQNPLYIPALGYGGENVFLAVFATAMLAGLISLVLRYRKGDESQRRQLRWLIWLLGIGFLFSLIPFQNIAGAFFGLIMQIIAYLFWQSFPAIGIAVAVLRYNLWDIDLVIRRTLVYGVLTVLLGLAYFGSVVLLQSIFELFAGRESQSPVVIVISTLIIAALFSPLRQRIQNGIDRRFFRQRYDTEKTLHSFAKATRSQVDLEELSSQLVTVVRETMQPETVSIWLQASGRRK
jgi:hypothetical protein